VQFGVDGRFGGGRRLEALRDFVAVAAVGDPRAETTPISITNAGAAPRRSRATAIAWVGMNSRIKPRTSEITPMTVIAVSSQVFHVR
jgi:hypothetical protein